MKVLNLIKSRVRNISRKKAVVIICSGALLLFLLLCTLIIPSYLLKKTKDYSYALYDKDGILLGARVASDEQWRFEPSEVPEKFKKAIINYEDKRFYYHIGVDFLSIGRAIKQNVQNNRIVSGGSTITMQTIRLLLGNPKRTYMQKIKEAFIAVIFELRFSKKKILELYSTYAPF